FPTPSNWIAKHPILIAGISNPPPKAACYIAESTSIVIFKFVSAPMSPTAEIIPFVTVQPAAPPQDCDPEETREWLESLEAMIHHLGPARAAYVLKQLESRAQQLGVAAHAPPYSAYQNTIPLEQQAAHPGDVAL